MAETGTAPDRTAPAPPPQDGDDRGDPGAPLPRRIALGVLSAIAALAYGWGTGTTPLEPYYAAAVRTMAGSWRAFAFGAFDPAMTITMDKLPGAFWLQAVSVRVFGFHPWALVLPQVVAGALTVPLLYRAVRRLAGPRAGLLAALVLTLSPAVVALDRGNIADTVMLLLLVAAADAVSGAVLDGRRWRLLLAALWVGLAFQAKMLEAWLVLPALALPYLVAGPGRASRRTLDLVLGGAVAAVLSTAWMTVVALVPAAARPWVDGSTTNSPFEQVFVYNGVGRGGASPLQALAAQGLTVGVTSEPGPFRLLLAPMATTAGWFLPLGVVIVVAGIAGRRGRPRTDLMRAGYLLWGAWLLLFAVVFSVLAQVNPYYTAALAPPAGALIGIGAVQAWTHRRSMRLRVLIVLLTVLTAGYGALLAARGNAPGWLAPVVVVVAVAAVVLVAIARQTAGRAVTSGFALVVVAVLLAPAVASATVVTRDEGALDVPLEPDRVTRGLRAFLVRLPERAAGSIPALERARGDASVLAAVQSAAVGSVFQEATSEEILPIGGFTGTGPVPSVDQLRDDVAGGVFHTALTFPTHDPRVEWLSAHCHRLEKSPPPYLTFRCSPEDARH